MGFLSLIAPLVTVVALDKLLISKWRHQRKLDRIRKIREENSEILKQRKEDAINAINLMRETSIRKMELENEKNGLLITEAMYGTFGETESENCRIDVTIPVQYMVNGSQLHISGGHSKSNINGFYDPCLGEEKELHIRYKFQGKMHQVQVKDKESVVAPLRSHIIT